MRWIILVFVMLIVLINAMPFLRKLGIGRLPGDINFSIRGRKIEIPLMSTLVLASAVLLIGRMI